MPAFAQLWDAPAERIADGAEEVALIIAAQAGAEYAVMRLFTAYVPALRSAVRQYGATLPLDDARQTACLAFLEIIREHDTTRCERLAGRLAKRLPDYLCEATSDASEGLTVPPRTLRRFFGFLRQADGDVLAAEELAVAAGMGRETFRAVLTAVRANRSLDAEVMIRGADHAVPLCDVSDYSRETSHAEDRLLVEVAFGAVNGAEEAVCRLAYGFEEFGEPVVDAEIGHRLGMTRLKALRTRQRALSKMREALGALAA